MMCVCADAGGNALAPDELVDADADADEEEEDGWNMRGHQWGRGQALEGDSKLFLLALFAE